MKVEVILEVKNVKKSIDAFALSWELYRRYNQKEESVKVREVKNVPFVLMIKAYSGFT